MILIAPAGKFDFPAGSMIVFGTDFVFAEGKLLETMLRLWLDVILINFTQASKQ
ncbi:hypothetical protein CLDAP_17210 [Caldilinea aerophila DSM 14535 = NBRC 104270]|uniref:Uncharacterized protein n=1 Tax=Caldilinea aerophila (strain DSM 14535 / JCM 11387 / NBRC 104270 / STL-6-O1) TaxID=926550 RepID=I0I3C3_CALAS|nr:hypothetical protein CLDAP_17210 [Caldilinea aerophila DSM 14535 = NBRC 104270]